MKTSTFAIFIKKIQWIAIAMFFIGICFVFASEYMNHLFGTIVSHIGVAFMVASMIGLIIELTEIKDFFEDRILNLVTNKGFLEILSDKKLGEHNVEIMKKIIQNKVDNDEYDYHSLPLTINSEILSQIGDVYREDYNETIEYHILEPEEIEQLPNAQLLKGIEIVKVKTNTRFYLIAPKENEEVEHTISSYWSVRKIPNYDSNNHYEIKLSIDDKLKELHKENFIKEESDMIVLALDYNVKFKKDLFVELETIMYEYGKTGNIYSYMETTTKNMTVHFSSDLPLDLDAEIFGLSDNYYEPSITKNSVGINYQGWMLQGNGYFISWIEKTLDSVKKESNLSL